MGAVTSFSGLESKRAGAPSRAGIVHVYSSARTSHALNRGEKIRTPPRLRDVPAEDGGIKLNGSLGVLAASFEQDDTCHEEHSFRNIGNHIQFPAAKGNPSFFAHKEKGTIPTRLTVEEANR